MAPSSIDPITQEKLFWVQMFLLAREGNKTVEETVALASSKVGLSKSSM